MRPTTRSLTRLLVGMLTFAVVAVVGSATAYASVPPPDPVSEGFPGLPPTVHATSGNELGWMLSGAGVALALAAIVAAVYVLVSRRVVTRRLRTS